MLILFHLVTPSYTSLANLSDLGYTSLGSVQVSRVRLGPHIGVDTTGLPWKRSAIPSGTNLECSHPGIKHHLHLG